MKKSVIFNTIDYSLINKIKNNKISYNKDYVYTLMLNNSIILETFYKKDILYLKDQKDEIENLYILTDISSTKSLRIMLDTFAEFRNLNNIKNIVVITNNNKDNSYFMSFLKLNRIDKYKNIGKEEDFENIILL